MLISVLLLTDLILGKVVHDLLEAAWVYCSFRFLHGWFHCHGVNGMRDEENKGAEQVTEAAPLK